jgi:hypothetical protein
MLKLAREKRFPGSRCVYWDVGNAVEVGRLLKLALHEGGNASGAQPPDKEPKLEDDILSRTLLNLLPSNPALIIRGH